MYRLFAFFTVACAVRKRLHESQQSEGKCTKIMSRYLCKTGSNPLDSDKVCIKKLCDEFSLDACCMVAKTFTVEGDNDATEQSATEAPPTTEAPTEPPTTEAPTEPPTTEAPTTIASAEENEDSELLGCVSWYDGCNTCSVENGKIGICTEVVCIHKGKTYCKQKAEPSTVESEEDSMEELLTTEAPDEDEEHDVTEDAEPVDCSDQVCPMDMCPDGEGRRQVGDDCCSCEAPEEVTGDA